MSQPLGRPRDSRVDEAIATAARQVLAEQGYARLTVDAVAARAGVGKAAIYRRHATKQQMIFAAVMHDLDLATPPDTGSLATDLAAITRDILAALATPPPGVVPALLADVHADPAMAAAFARTFVRAERDCVTEVLERAVARGELPRLPDPATVHALLLGPIFAWLFLLLEDPGKAPAFADTLARGVGHLLGRDGGA
ncbi:TetR/AcrR family transcriptional regulator [Nonomuraea rhodomycinica]|uniref:TetR/AcrR family transcriptional regulator n=1 Tax=Nonomuraea rhodomycinica TaxID=1712872 RepID=A0A7Y6IRG5_9ACTN|nr:TetR/AcrR family transcriptional regulator [Nonomuraea rhodomycinica]NUW42533.1 TetR/AcrR family transcriptional regulator [Nonomuraea rhodomycinica]